MDNICCTRCRSTLKIHAEFPSQAVLIYSCKCFKYPSFLNVLYLHQNAKSKEAVRLIENGKFLQAFIHVLDIPTPAKVLFLLIFYPHFINGIVKIIFQKNIGQLLGFFMVLRMMRTLGYSQNWTKYLLNRSRIPSYLSARAFINNLKSGTVVDLGTGVGFLIPIIYDKLRPDKLIALDKCFSHLILAKMFFANNTANLVCCDFAYGLPLRSRSVDSILDVNSFQYYQNQPLILKEMDRVLNKEGNALLIHILYQHALLTAETKLREVKKNFDIFKELRLKAYFLSDAEYWKSVLTRRPVSLTEKITNTLDDSNHYAIFISRSRHLKLIVDPLSKSELRTVDYYQDKNLLKAELLVKYIEPFDNFIFISPHLDDAVFSCGSLLGLLNSLGKKITVVTVFTEVTRGPYSDQAKEFTQSSGFDDPFLLFDVRKKEDQRALSIIKAQIVHLGFVDAAWRKSAWYQHFKVIGKYLAFIPGLTHVYPNAKKQFSGRLSLQDNGVKLQIKEKLNHLLNKKKVLLLGPYAIGGHADHVIIREVISELHTPVLYWSDYPYNKELGMRELYYKDRESGQIYELEVSKIKQKMVKCYKTQRRIMPAFMRTE